MAIKTTLLHLQSKTTWSKEDDVLFQDLAKSFDIGKKDTLPLREDINLLTLWLIVITHAIHQASALPLQLKRWNTFYKAFNALPKEFQETHPMPSGWQELLSQLPEKSNYHVEPCVPSALNDLPSPAQTLPITVLFYEGPIARAYLSLFYHLGLKPERIIALIPSHDSITKKPVGQWLPNVIQHPYARARHYRQIHHWPHFLQKSHTALWTHICQKIEEQWHIPQAWQIEAQKNHPLSRYSDNIEYLMIENLKDPLLYQTLEQRFSPSEKSALLFTGGGIVPANLLAIPNLVFLHVHPGYLPLIRGADCTLWSSLLTGHASATSFYMSPGIDTGDIILPCWLPKLSLMNLFQSHDLTLKMKYRAIYSFVDPWVRVFALRELLAQHYAQYHRFTDLPNTPQTEDAGITYHFMQDTLVKKCF